MNEKGATTKIKIYFTSFFEIKIFGDFSFKFLNIVYFYQIQSKRSFYRQEFLSFDYTSKIKF